MHDLTKQLFLGSLVEINEVQMDGSAKGVGAVLSKIGKPMECISEKLSLPGRKEYLQIEVQSLIPVLAT